MEREQRVLERSLLYLSFYLKANRQEYDDRLMAIRFKDNWAGWLKFFLRGVAEVSEYATLTARRLIAVRDGDRLMHSGSALSLAFVDILIEHPVLNINSASEYLGASYVTARTIIEQFKANGHVTELTGRARNKVYRYLPFVDLLQEQHSAMPEDVPSSIGRDKVS